MPLLVAPAIKLFPVTVRVVLEDPAAIDLGLSELMMGASTVNVDTADVAPPLGFCTVTLRFPALPSMLPGTVAVIEVAVPAVTVNAVPPTYATEPAVNVPSLVVPAMKLLPATVSVVLDEPAAMDFGVSELMIGATTDNMDADETAPPLGFLTVTSSSPRCPT